MEVAFWKRPKKEAPTKFYKFGLSAAVSLTIPCLLLHPQFWPPISLDMLVLCSTTPGAACGDVFDLVVIQGALKQQQQ